MFDEYKRFTLRINSKLFELIKAKAKEDKRPIGKEMEFILEQFIAKKVSDK